MSMRTVAIPPPERSLTEGWEALLECIMASEPEPEITPAYTAPIARDIPDLRNDDNYLPILRRQRLSREVYQPVARTSHPSRSYGRLHNRQSATWLPTLRVA
jgi:hypothetical protein